MKKIKEEIVLTTYKMDTQLGIKAAVVSDLHDMKSERLVDMLNEISPDVILCPGDIFERGRYLKNGSISKTDGILKRLLMVADDIFELFFGKKPEPKREAGYDFISKAEAIAPVYMSIGNHDYYLTEKDRIFLKENKVTLLENSFVTATIRNRKICIGGLSTDCDLTFLDEFSMNENYKLLLCHHPEHYINLIKSNPSYSFDLVLSGHAHGGQWVFFGKPVFAPGQGIFPKYVRGKYDNFIVSAGVSNTCSVPRFNNPCEVVEILL